MKRVLEWLLRLGLGALFVAAGALKLADPTAFAVEVANYHIVPSLAPYLAATMPAIEIVLGAALVVAPAPWRRASALATTLLMILFTVAVTQAVARGINVSCGCFGGASGPVTPVTMARDVALLAASAALFFLARPSLPRTPR